jgi:prepilin-type N-terminal cleavage/methylation domain-containing protein
MKALKHPLLNTGMTLVEIIVVIAVIGLIASLGLIVDLKSFKTETLHSEESRVVAILEKARSRSMANLNDDAHGVCYEAPNYVLFEEDDGCDASASESELFDANANIANSSDYTTNFPTVVFEQLSGRLTSAETITITDGIKTEIITINEEGAIHW